MLAYPIGKVHHTVEVGGKKVCRNNSVRLSGVAAKPAPSLRGGMGVVLVPMPHLARDHMLAGLAASHMEL